MINSLEMRGVETQDYDVNHDTSETYVSNVNQRCIEI